MANANCPQHNCELVGIGSFSFCPQCERASVSSLQPCKRYWFIYGEGGKREITLYKKDPIFRDREQAEKVALRESKQYHATHRLTPDQYLYSGAAEQFDLHLGEHPLGNRYFIDCPMTLVGVVVRDEGKIT